MLINAPVVGSNDTGSTMNEWHVIVVNNGAQAASIANVGVRSDDRSSNVDLVFLRDNDAQVGGPQLPARVEAHGALEWTLSHETAG